MLLSTSPEINHVSANILTGNVLIIFDPECNVRKISSDVEKIVIACARELRNGSEAHHGETSQVRSRAKVRSSVEQISSLALRESTNPNAGICWT